MLSYYMMYILRARTAAPQTSRPGSDAGRSAAPAGLRAGAPGRREFQMAAAKAAVMQAVRRPGQAAGRPGHSGG